MSASERKLHGLKLKQIRKKKNLTIEQMAKIMQTSESRVIRIESGRFGIYLSEALKIKQATGIDLIWELT